MVTWYAHQKIIGETRVAEFERVIRSLGDNCLIYQGSKYISPEINSNGKAFPGVAFLPIQHAIALEKTEDAFVKAIPKLYFHQKKFHVSQWMTRLDDAVLCLNHGCLFVPFGTIQRFPDAVFKEYSKTGAIFVRPDSGLKGFTGFAIPADNMRCFFDVKKEIAKQTRGLVNSADMICISKGYELDPIEWRFWIANRQVVAWSPYSWEYDNIAITTPPSGAFEIADMMANNTWQPDISYVVDVVSVLGNFFLNEINATSTSGMYQVDFNKLIPALRSAVLQEFNQEISIED